MGVDCRRRDGEIKRLAHGNEAATHSFRTFFVCQETKTVANIPRHEQIQRHPRTHCPRVSDSPGHGWLRRHHRTSVSQSWSASCTTLRPPLRACRSSVRRASPRSTATLPVPRWRKSPPALFRPKPAAQPVLPAQPLRCPVARLQTRAHPPATIPGSSKASPKLRLATPT